MSAGLAASTVTPGSSAPVASFTSPAMAPLKAVCAATDTGSNRTANVTMRRASFPAVIGFYFATRIRASAGFETLQHAAEAKSTTDAALRNTAEYGMWRGG